MLLWNKLFKNGPSKICGRQPLKNLKGYSLPKGIWFVPYLPPSSKYDTAVSKDIESSKIGNNSEQKQSAIKLEDKMTLQNYVSPLCKRANQKL